MFYEFKKKMYLDITIYYIKLYKMINTKINIFKKIIKKTCVKFMLRFA